MLVTRCVERIDLPSPAQREAVLREPVTETSFRRAFDEFESLHAVEVMASPAAADRLDTARIVFWNAERLKYAAPSAAMLERAAGDVVLLCEVDLGMARSGNRHTVADLAAALGTGYVFGVEFVELGLGDARERAWHAGQDNTAGLHGAAILSRHVLDRPALARLERSGRWFDGNFGERRVGGRMALMAEVTVAGRQVLVVSVHFESHSDPEDRALQTERLLDAIDEHAPGLSVLIGGDFNTSTFDLAEKDDPAVVAAALAVEPDRLVAPMAHEPMFETLRRRGYDWDRCNVPLAVTQRTRPDGTPKPPYGKIDWLFTRGLRCCDPAVIAAVDEAGVAISDHEALAVTVAPA
ncbi:MAG: endonuclease/exonuclease/phosphatase family protein [Geminicoccaceae bacterium]